jgi:hypothetical protein
LDAFEMFIKMFAVTTFLICALALLR